MRTSFTILLVTVLHSLLAQKAINYSYKFSDSITHQLSLDSCYDRAAWEYSYIGEYATDLIVWDKQEHSPDQIDVEEIERFRKFKAVDGKNYILEKARTEKVIILNEAHQQSYHRIFTTSLLEGLYKEGYRYFGAETISGDDWGLNERKFPIMKTGYYTKEPCYGNMIREALRIGFTVFSYETRRTTANVDSAGHNVREIDQARNIKKILDKDSNAKVLIHCGFGHLIECPVRSWGKAMAGRLTEYTGINPLTIDQVRLTEHSSNDFENPYFRLLSPDYYAVFIDSLGTPLKGPVGFSQFDLMLSHPRTTWLYGRPHWMFEDGRKPFFIHKKVELSFPCLVTAYLAEEYTTVQDIRDMPVPFDVIELKDKSDEKALSLKKGIYVIVARNPGGQKQTIRISVE